MTAEVTPGKLVELVRSLIKSVQYCFLITQDERGEVHARLMQPFAPEDDLTIWFGTSPHTRKAHDIRCNPNVTVTYQYDDDNAYIVLSGQAELVDDLALRQHHWLDVWEPFFAGGPTSDNYVLIRFRPTRIEIMDFAKNITPPPYGLSHVDLVRGDGAWLIESAR